MPEFEQAISVRDVELNDAIASVSDVNLKNAVTALNDLIDRHFEGARRVAVLEAGGGSRSFINFALNSGRTHVTTIDISKEQLDSNDYADEKILGDLRTYALPNDRFDLVVCYDVLEHLDQPRPVIESLCRATKPGGVLVIGAPNPASLAGLITKLTPHAFHVFVYRYIFGDKNAGKPGMYPFPTFLRNLMRPHNVAAMSRRYDMDTLYMNLYETDRFWASPHFYQVTWDLACFLLRACTLFQWNPRLSNYHLVLRKKST
jgi:2-polyprenyl-3-methyl-5-hydroxy-6-metoxy-1,4-benzoquinol methylase